MLLANNIGPNRATLGNISTQRQKGKSTKNKGNCEPQSTSAPHWHNTVAGSNDASYYETAKLLHHILLSTAVAAAQNAAMSGSSQRAHPVAARC